MVDETIRSIKEAEQQAEKLLEDAKKQKEQIQKEALLQAKQVREEILEEAKKTAAGLGEKARKEAKDQEAEEESRRKTMVKELKEAAGKKKAEAVELVLSELI